jgi:hypothetical protein
MARDVTGGMEQVVAVEEDGRCRHLPWNSGLLRSSRTLENLATVGDSIPNRTFHHVDHTRGEASAGSTIGCAIDGK